MDSKDKDSNQAFNIQLIRLVKESPLLYDPSLGADSDTKAQIWKRIAGTLKVEELLVRRRYRHLRDRFVRERRLGIKRWKLYKHLEFISEYISEPRRSIGNELTKIKKKERKSKDPLKDLTDDMDDSSDIFSCSNSIENIQIPEPWNSRELFSTFKKDPEGGDDTDDDKDDVTVCNEVNKDDEDTLFLLSLAPALKRMNRSDKNNVKIRILEMVSEYDV